jgi:protein-disulfide isomerase
VTDEDVDTLYAAHKNALKGTEAELKGLIRAQLQNQRLGERHKAFLESLRSHAEIAVHFKEPLGLNVPVSAEGAPSLGPSDAPVTIVEFSDFQCLDCKRVLATVVQLRSRYRDKVRLVFRDFPRDEVHARARRAAEAARCANDQHKFWEYHDLLFANAPRATSEDLQAYAQKAGLDVAKFEQCVSSGTHAATVQKDVDEARRLGVMDAPAFFVNGRFVSLALPMESFVRVIDEELSRAK